jgi:hypothetical protein
VALDSATLDASANPTALPSIRDGSVETAWTTDGPQRPGEWIELSFDRPHRLARVELVLKRRAQQGVDLVLWTSVDGGPWVQPRQLRGRPAVEEQADPPSQVFIIEPARVSRLRAVQNGTGRLRWGVAEVRAWEIDEEPRR